MDVIAYPYPKLNVGTAVGIFCTIYNYPCQGISQLSVSVASEVENSDDNGCNAFKSNLELNLLVTYLIIRETDFKIRVNALNPIWVY